MTKKVPYSACNEIKKYAKMFGVTICLEFDASSQEALMGVKYLYEKKDKILTIVISELTIEERNLVLDIIRQIHEQGELIWRGTKKETLAAYKLYSSNNKNKDTLDFFEKILDKDDYSALKMAYFIKNEMQAGHKVFEYKKDIRDRFGERGANIANLCRLVILRKNSSHFMKHLKKISMVIMN